MDERDGAICFLQGELTFGVNAFGVDCRHELPGKHWVGAQRMILLLGKNGST